MKRITRYGLYVVALLAVLSGCQPGNDDKKIISLKETYSKTDKKPFGGYVARQQLEAMYYNNTVREKRQPFDETWLDISGMDSSSLYVCITPSLYVNDDEVAAMLQFVEAGNDLFIAAGYIDDLLMRRVGCKANYSISALIDPVFAMHNTFTKSLAKGGNAYSYFYLPFDNSFSDIDSSDSKVLGTNEHGAPNFIVHFYGRGKLFLHCDPRAFSNYFLLKHDNYKYMQAAMGYTYEQPYHLYWDDHYYKLRSRSGSSGSGGGGRGGKRNNDNSSGLDEINKYPPLVFAFWLGLLLLVLYILFGGKRRQRIVQAKKPNENTTVTFTETIGRLYLQKKDNKNIAEKMITYFNEFIRNNYFLNTSVADSDFITALSRKSGVSHNKVEALYRTIYHAQQSATVDDFQLLSLNEQIQHFYKTINKQ